MVPFSVLDLCPVVLGATPADAFRNTRDLAQHAERWGYRRYWLAEHHNMRGIASAATAVVVGHVAAATSTMRVGAGGIMLPNHAPLVVAEQFGTLECLYPGRIDLGLGRAPGTDQRTAIALRRTLVGGVDRFPEDVRELMGYFEKAEPGQAIRAVPGEGLRVPIYLLGSSLFSAQLAAELGLPYAFASHFAPDHLMAALDLYRRTFRPSETQPRPYAMVGVNVIAADTDHDARRLFTSLEQQFLNLRRGMPSRLQPPLEPAADRWTPEEQAAIHHVLACSAVGSAATVRAALSALVEATAADELIVTAQIYDHAARLRSFEIAASVRDSFQGSVDPVSTSPS
jgi:luciferase family oxidoreductase group 1